MSNQFTTLDDFIRDDIDKAQDVYYESLEHLEKAIEGLTKYRAMYPLKERIPRLYSAHSTAVISFVFFCEDALKKDELEYLFMELMDPELRSAFKELIKETLSKKEDWENEPWMEAAAKRDYPFLFEDK